MKIAYKELATFTALYQGAALGIITIFDIGTTCFLSSSPSASILCPSDLHSLHESEDMPGHAPASTRTYTGHGPASILSPRRSHDHLPSSLDSAGLMASSPSIGLASMVRALTFMVTEEKEALTSLASTISGHTDLIPEKLIQRYNLEVQRHIDILISELYPTVDRVTEPMTEEWESFDEVEFSRVLKMQGEVSTLLKAAFDLLGALQTSAPASTAALPLADLIVLAPTSARLTSASPDPLTLTSPTSSPPTGISSPASPPAGTSSPASTLALSPWTSAKASPGPAHPDAASPGQVLTSATTSTAAPSPCLASPSPASDSWTPPSDSAHAPCHPGDGGHILRPPGNVDHTLWPPDDDWRPPHVSSSPERPSDVSSSPDRPPDVSSPPEQPPDVPSPLSMTSSSSPASAILQTSLRTAPTTYSSQVTSPKSVTSPRTATLASSLRAPSNLNLWPPGDRDLDPVGHGLAPRPRDDPTRPPSDADLVLQPPLDADHGLGPPGDAHLGLRPPDDAAHGTQLPHDARLRPWPPDDTLLTHEVPYVGPGLCEAPDDGPGLYEVPDDLPPDVGGQPPPRPDVVAQPRPPKDSGQPPPPPDDGWTQGNGTFPVFPSVPGPRRSGERAMMTSTLVPIFAAALLWRHLHSTPEAVTSADGLPVGHDTRPVLCLFPSQDQDFKSEHSVTSSSQDILCQ